MKELFTDVETTGLTERHGLHQISGIIRIDMKDIEKFNFNCATFPDDIFDEELLISDKCHKTKQQILNSPNPLDVFYQFYEMLNYYVDRYNKEDKFQFLAYNSPFDSEQTRSWVKKCFNAGIPRKLFKENDKDFWYGSMFWNPDICICRALHKAIGNKRKLLHDFKLHTVAKFLNIPFDENRAHDAFYDIEIAKIMYDMIESKLK